MIMTFITKVEYVGSVTLMDALINAVFIHLNKDMFAQPLNVLHSRFRLSTDFDRFIGNTTDVEQDMLYLTGAPDVNLGFYASLNCPGFSFKCCFLSVSMFAFFSFLVLSVL